MLKTRRIALLVSMVLTGIAVVGAQELRKNQTASSPGTASRVAPPPRGLIPMLPQDPAGQPKEAPAGFTLASNGFEDQDAFNADRKVFEEVEDITTNGLGPVYNTTSCVGCHQNPITGSASQISELRAGHNQPDPNDPTKVRFVEPPSGSLIHQRAINAAIQEHVQPGNEIVTLRMSTNILGDGFIEMIPDTEIRDYSYSQPDGLKGTIILVPVVLTGTTKPNGDIDFQFNEQRVGRFGWKCQEASLINFAAGAYLNEMGVTSPLQPTENTSNGRDVSWFDNVLDPEDKVDPADADNVLHPDQPFGDDVKAFTRFMRSTRVPPREFATVNSQDVKDGEVIFKTDATLACAVCHRPDYTTPLAGTAIKGLDSNPGSDLVTVPNALGNKTIHPYSDFMMHDIGTGDGIVQAQHAQRPAYGSSSRRQGVNARPKALRSVRDKPLNQGVTAEVDPQETATMIRTAPLWGLRTRPQLMHDGQSVTLEDAILRHKVNAGPVQLPANYTALDTTPEGKEKIRKLKAFLNSL